MVLSPVDCGASPQRIIRPCRILYDVLTISSPYTGCEHTIGDITRRRSSLVVLGPSAFVQPLF